MVFQQLDNHSNHKSDRYSAYQKNHNHIHSQYSNHSSKTISPLKTTTNFGRVSSPPPFISTTHSGWHFLQPSPRCLVRPNTQSVGMLDLARHTISGRTDFTLSLHRATNPRAHRHQVSEANFSNRLGDK
jgi:hypothetical protein